MNDIAYRIKAAGPVQNCLILCNSLPRCHDLSLVARACNIEVLESNWSLGKQYNPNAIPNVDYLLIEIMSDSERPDQSLEQICDYLSRHRSNVLMWTDMNMLERIYAALPAGCCHFLVDSSDVDAMPILSGALTRMKINEFHDQKNANNYGALHRISDELSEFARTLARIAESDGDQNIVSDKPISFRAAPPGAFLPLVEQQPEPIAHSAEAIRDIIKLRRLRNSYFDAELFADPAWDILLDLWAASLEKKNVSVSSLCIAAAVPATTALRWVTAMTDSGLLVRHHDPKDARRVFITLSDEAKRSMEQYFNEAQKRSGLKI